MGEKIQVSLPTHDTHPEQQVRKETLLAHLNQYPFRAPRWLRGRHHQTLWAALMRRLPYPERTREELETPDQDWLHLHHYAGLPNKPMVLLLHGLEGHRDSPYIRALHRPFGEMGWHVYSMEYRSCSGAMNHARRLYHSGETTDLDFVIRHLLSKHPERPLYLGGFSLGGNVIAKWLGEQAKDVTPLVKGAAVVGVPYDLTTSGPVVDRVLGGIYAKHFMRTMIPKALEKERQFPGTLDIERVRRARTFEEFDTLVTAVLHGFQDARDYWEKASSGPYLPSIHVPTMLLSAADDPFNPASTLPKEAASRSPFLVPQFTERGGHVGFVTGKPWRTGNWAEEQMIRFFQLLDAGYAAC